MDTENAFWYLEELQDTITWEVIDEWKNAKGKENVFQAWKVAPAGLVKREWEYNAKTGLVHDKIIDKIQTIFIENFLKLAINTILMGHEEMSAYEFLESFLPEDWNEKKLTKWLEGFEDFISDKTNNYHWRISDYGIARMRPFIYALVEEEDYNKKLFWLDQILSVTHARSDLAAWFIEGGTKTLNCIFENCPLTELEFSV